VHMQADQQYALGELPEDLSSAAESRLHGIQYPWIATPPAYTGPENRKSPRIATDDPAVLTVLKPDRSPRIKMRILDSSKEGMKLQLPQQLMTGTIVQVHVRDLFILAEVRYSRRVGSTFHSGVQIHDVFPACG
jgi:hypothetical protein